MGIKSLQDPIDTITAQGRFTLFRRQGESLKAVNESETLTSDSLFENFQEADDDDLYDEAAAIVRKTGKVSTAILQRRLRIGYGRAARLIDMLEQRGVVGPADGSKPRAVLLK